jgi:para-nitrobenzyl esterase
MTVDVMRRTRLGSVRGLEEAGAQSFLGLRYAEPPKRFQAPVRSGAWGSVYDATLPRARAMQGPDRGRLVDAAGPTSEDSLFLNIHVPAAPADVLRPVIFWVHGGSLTNGSANESDGSTLARLADAVVVCPNYRLGIFGMADLRRCGAEFAVTPSLWLLDLVAALEWVRDHIADYGGDPGRVLAAGQSAGGAAVLALVGVGAADGLITSVMANSPACLSADHSHVAERVAGIRGTSADEALGYLLDAPADDLVDLQVSTPGLLAGAIVDGTVLTAPLDELLRQRRPAVPLVTGFTRNEGAAINAVLGDVLPEPIVDLLASHFAAPPVGGLANVPAYLERLRAIHPWSSAYELIQLVGTDICRRTSTEYVQATRDAGGQAWQYRLEVPTTMGGQPADSPHSCDIPFTFNWFANPTPPDNGFLRIDHPGAPALANRWTAMIAQFARTGDPSGLLGTWPSWDPATRPTLLISPDACTLTHNLDPEYPTSIWPAA